MTFLYRYIFSADLPAYLAAGWELCGPMKGRGYCGGYADTVIVRKEER